MRPRTGVKLLLAAAASVAAFVLVATRVLATWGGGGGDHWADSPLWREDVRRHLNPHRYAQLRNPRHLCPAPDRRAEVSLLVLVASAVAHSDRRDAIRRSWGHPRRLADGHAALLFLLGRGDPEDAGSRDILQEDFEDTYHNLTLKTVMGLKWASIFCPQAKFVLKTDDDIYVNLPLLLDALSSENFAAITGCIKNGPDAPQPIPQPGLSEDAIRRLPPAHPAFAAGAGYVLRGDAARRLYLASLDARLFPVEDVYVTAHCARRAGLHPPAHDRRFSCGQMAPDDDCRMARQFTAHKVAPERQGRILAALEGGKCPSAP